MIMWSSFHIFLTVKFRKDLWKKKEFKLPPPIKSVATVPYEMQVVNYTVLQHS